MDEIITERKNILDCAAGTGIYSFYFSEKVDEWNEKEFQIWCDYHYSICRESSLLGASNHVIIIGKK